MLKRFAILGVAVSAVTALSVAAQRRRPSPPAGGFSPVSLSTELAANPARALDLYTPGSARLTLDRDDGRDLGPRSGNWERGGDDGLSFHQSAVPDMAMAASDPVRDARPDDPRASLSGDRRVLPGSMTPKPDAVSWGWLADTVQDFEDPSAALQPLTPASAFDMPLLPEKDRTPDLGEAGLMFEKEMLKVWDQGASGEPPPPSLLPAPASTGPRQGNPSWLAP